MHFVPARCPAQNSVNGLYVQSAQKRGIKMIQLGKTQKLKVLRTTSIGVYLGETYDPLAVFSRKTTANASSMTETPDILLPNNEIKDKLEVGDEVKVFVYKDSEDRPIATTKFPPLQIGTTAPLKVKQVNNVGAFLDWGLPKDLMLPFREQTAKVEEGDTALVTLYVDKSSRLCASMKLYHHLRTDGEFQKDEWVNGRVYEISENFGAFVAVDDRFSALIPRNTLSEKLTVGQCIKARIVKIQEDGKLELSLKEPVYKQLDDDCKIILDSLAKADGFLPYHDKSSPDEIRDYFQMTKNQFKRTIGHLFKQKKIIIEKNGIRLS